MIHIFLEEAMEQTRLRMAKGTIRYGIRKELQQKIWNLGRMEMMQNFGSREVTIRLF